MHFPHFSFNRVLPIATCVTVIMMLMGISGCIFISHESSAPEDRYAKISKKDSFGDSASRVVYPQQNWSPEDSLWFYTATQGSNLMPYDIFLHLEMPDSRLLFRGDENMNRLRYLPQKSARANPDALPVGWVKNEYAGKSYIGFNCAACHTSQINYRGKAIRIDGGATLADMDLMMATLVEALSTSLNQADKFERLAKQVLKNNYPAEREAFRAELASVAHQIETYNRINAPRSGDKLTAYGFGRLDAFGRIYNRILEHLTPGDETNHNPPNAPVSYSYLWDTPFHDFVEWNGVGNNEGKGPLLRNTGQALGVFASFDFSEQEKSSIHIPNLIEMERSLERLWSPQWQELAERGALPPINKALAEKGRKVFEDYQCHSCHESIDRTDRNRRIIARFSSLPRLGTDPLMARNSLEYRGKSGLFEGQRLDPDNPDSTFPPVTFALPALSFAANLKSPEDGPDGVAIAAAINSNPINASHRSLDFEFVNKDDHRALAAYKARPLNGVWASAPYLHNGSVPSLYELFLPSCSDEEIAKGKACRPNQFVLGVRELDPVKVGFVQRDPARYPGLFVFDTSLAGNSNKGHEYAAGVTPVFVLDGNGKPVRDSDGKPLLRRLPPMDNDQRLALVEYLKSL